MQSLLPVYAALLLALATGCGGVGSGVGTTSAAPGPTVSATPRVSPTPAATARLLTPPSGVAPLLLLPAACAARDLQFGPGPSYDPEGTLRGSFVRVRNTSSRTCWAGGTPDVTLLGVHGHRLRFARERSYGNPPHHVVIEPGQAAWLFVGSFRCDLRTVATARLVRLRLPTLDGSFEVRLPRDGPDAVQLCGGTGADRSPQVTALSRRQLQPVGGPAPGTPDAVAVRMEDPNEDLGHYGAEPTYGRADLNGDGRLDVVVVRPPGLVVAHVSGLGVRIAKLPADGSVSLRGLGDLTDSGRADVLVGGVAANGAEDLIDDTWLRLRHGRLGVVRRLGGAPVELDFDSGEGDGFSRVVCAPGDIEQIRGLLDDRYLTTHEITVRGLVATDVPAGRVPSADFHAGEATAIGCPGLDGFGRAR